ncbi:MAG: 50S ribosomal protein L10 [Armatimonadota bacterium]|nr:50S ribosomal protein L10 [bacterium]MCS7308733.1 50S ribosomal protein L10 [Armatimonadota bacterium]MDW8104961.1 50S ribosomal protein L10 [Armatimonadota bacterium]MDW8289913.1 50S ribosomal protein L10 [Armatimonadota bacterium]
MRSGPNPQKVAQVEQLRQWLSTSKGVIFTDYRGLNVSQITQLRRQLRQNQAEYHVVKNTLFRLATKGIIQDNLDDILQGPTAVAFIQGDEAAAAKALSDATRELRVLTIKGAVLGGRVYSAEVVQQLAKLPPREVLIAQVLGGLQAPITGLVGTLQGILRDFVYTIQAIADKKSAQDA